MLGSEYDALSEVYDEWVSGDPVAQPCAEFYLSFCRPYDGLVLELGVGTGRIALPLGLSGKRVIGLDRSEQMLRRCSQKAAELGISERLRLVQGDLREFSLDEKADLVIFPMRSIGHLLTVEDRCSAFRAVHNNMKMGGRFVIDHYVFSAEWANAHDRIPRLMYFGSSQDGAKLAIWDTYSYSFNDRLMNCCITIERLDADGKVLTRRHCPLSFSWVEPAEVAALANEAGFVVESVFGDFERTAFTANSTEQIWVFRK